MLTTNEFVQHLTRTDWTSSNLLDVLEVALDVQLFVRLLEESSLSLVRTHEGIVSIVQEGGGTDDLSRQSSFFDFHTDGLYYRQVPDAVILACENSGIRGTRTFFSDTCAALATLQGSEEMEILSALDLGYVDRDGGIHTRPLIERHPRSHEAVINLGSRAFVQPKPRDGRADAPTCPALRSVVRALDSLYKALDDAIVLEHRWRVKDVIVFDNNRYVHGRRGQGKDPIRKLLRFWLRLQPQTIGGLVS